MTESYLSSRDSIASLSKESAFSSEAFLFEVMLTRLLLTSSIRPLDSTASWRNLQLGNLSPQGTSLSSEILLSKDLLRSSRCCCFSVSRRSSLSTSRTDSLSFFRSSYENWAENSSILLKCFSLSRTNSSLLSLLDLASLNLFSVLDFWTLILSMSISIFG